MWLHSVAWRAAWSTRASTGSSASSAPLLDDHRERLVVAEAEYALHARAAVAVLALDRAHVGDLTAAGGVEGDSASLTRRRLPFAGRTPITDAPHRPPRPPRLGPLHEEPSSDLGKGANGVRCVSVS